MQQASNQASPDWVVGQFVPTTETSQRQKTDSAVPALGLALGASSVVCAMPV